MPSAPRLCQSVHTATPCMTHLHGHKQLLPASVNPQVESCTHITHEMHIFSEMAFISFLFYYGHGNILLFEITVIGESYDLEFNFRLVEGLWVQRDNCPDNKSSSEGLSGSDSLFDGCVGGCTLWKLE